MLYLNLPDTASIGGHYDVTIKPTRVAVAAPSGAFSFISTARSFA